MFVFKLLFALLAEVNASSSSYSGIEKLSITPASHRRAMEELRSQRWQWLLAAEDKETHTEPTLKEANISGWQWVGEGPKSTSTELTLEEVDLLPKVNHHLMQEVTFQEKLLPPPQKSLPTATFDFVAEHQEVTAAGDGKPNYSGAGVPHQNVKINALCIKQCTMRLPFSKNGN